MALKKILLKLCKSHVHNCIILYCIALYYIVLYIDIYSASHGVNQTEALSMHFSSKKKERLKTK